MEKHKIAHVLQLYYLGSILYTSYNEPYANDIQDCVKFWSNLDKLGAISKILYSGVIVQYIDHVDSEYK